jgi:hypothetical protein
MSDEPSNRPFIDHSIYRTDGLPPNRLIYRCVVFSEDQLLQAFAPLDCPDMALVVKDGRCKWVTNASAGVAFFRDID